MSHLKSADQGGTNDHMFLPEPAQRNTLVSTALCKVGVIGSLSGALFFMTDALCSFDFMSFKCEKDVS